MSGLTISALVYVVLILIVVYLALRQESQRRELKKIHKIVTYLELINECRRMIEGVSNQNNIEMNFSEDEIAKAYAEGLPSSVEDEEFINSFNGKGNT